MTVTTQDKHGAYTTHQRAQEDSRETDKRALLSCASRLKSVLDSGGGDRNAYADAIRNNQRLWTIFQVALCDQENQLPRDVKLILLNLSRYVDRTSFSAITEFAPHLLTSLIDINRIVAAGLSKKPNADKMPPPAEVRPPLTSLMTSA